MDPTNAPWLQQRRTVYHPETNRLHPQNTGETACKAWARQELFALATPPDCTRISRWGRELDPGQLQHGIRFFKRRWNWGTGTVHRFLSDLEQEQEIRRLDPDDRGSTEAKVIEVCNYLAHQRPWRNGGTHSGDQDGKGIGSQQQLPEDAAGGHSDGSGKTERKATGKASRKAERNQVKEEKKNGQKNTDSVPRQNGKPAAPEADPSTPPHPPEKRPSRRAVDRIVESWHQTIVEVFTEVKGSPSGSRLKLTDKRRSRIRDLVEMGYDRKNDLEPAVRQVLHSHYWEGMGGSSQYLTLLRNGGENLEMYRDKWEERSRAQSHDRGLDFEEREQAEDEAAEQWIDENV